MKSSAVIPLPSTRPFQPEWNNYFQKLSDSLFPVAYQFAPSLTGVTGAAQGIVISVTTLHVMSVSIATGNSVSGVLTLPFTPSIDMLFTVLAGTETQVHAPAGADTINLPNWSAQSAIIYGIGVA